MPTETSKASEESGKYETDGKEKPGPSGESSASGSSSQNPKKNPRKQRDTFSRGPPFQIYSVSGHAGVGIILNYIELSDPDMLLRAGSDVDTAALRRTFQNFGLKIFLKQAPTTSETRALIDEALAHINNNGCDVFMMGVLSNGRMAHNESLLSTKDGELRITEDLLFPFTSSQCAALEGKPKLFFFQACQEGHEWFGIPSETPGKAATASELEARPLLNTLEPEPISIPTYADLLVAYSTTPRHFSWRNSVKGSWFINALTEVLDCYADGTKEILHLLTEVNRRVELSHTIKPSHEIQWGRKQVPIVHHCLTKQLYLRNKRL